MAAATATSGALRVLLERAADPSPSTPLVLPYLTGERAPGWAGDARAILSGVSAASTPADLFRWIVEGVAISYARVADELAPAAPTRWRPWAGRTSPRTAAWTTTGSAGKSSTGATAA